MRLNRVVIALLRLYKAHVSPIISRKVSCRFHPTCSEYALLCFENFSFCLAVTRTFLRLKRCNPRNFDSCIDYPELGLASPDSGISS